MDSNPLPPPDAQASPEDPLAPKSRGRRLLFGCGCGCAVFLTALIVASMWGVNYLFGAGTQVPSDYVLGRDTAAFIHLAPASDDEPTRRLIESLVETLGSLDPESIDEAAHPELKGLVQAFQDVGSEATGELLSFFPRSMTIAIQPDPELVGSFHAVGALNLTKGSRFVRVLVQAIADGAQEHQHGDHKILGFGVEGLDGELQETDFLAFQHDTLLFSSSLELLGDTLDQTESYDPESDLNAPPASHLRPQLTELSDRWLISAAAGGEVPVPPGLLRNLTVGLPARYFEDAVGARDWLDTPMGSLRIGSGLAGADATLRVELLGLNGVDVPRLQAGLERVLTQLTTELAHSDLALAHELLTGGDSIVVNARLKDFREWLNERLRRLADE